MLGGWGQLDNTSTNVSNKGESFSAILKHALREKRRSREITRIVGSVTLPDQRLSLTNSQPDEGYNLVSDGIISRTNMFSSVTRIYLRLELGVHIVLDHLRDQVVGQANRRDRYAGLSILPSCDSTNNH